MGVRGGIMGVGAGGEKKEIVKGKEKRGGRS